MRVAWRARQRRVQHVRDLGPIRPPLRQRARGGVMRRVAQRQRRQRAQHRLGVVRAHAPAHAHVGGTQALVHSHVTGRHRAHQHVAATRRVLGQRVHRDVYALPFGQRERIERDACAPGVVECNECAARARRAHQRRQVGELHRDRARRLDPHELRRRREHVGQCLRIGGVIQAVRDAPARQFLACQFAAGAVCVVGDQHLVASHQQRHVGERDRCEAARHQQRLQPAFERGDALFQHERGGRAVQAVGVAGLALPIPRAHRGGAVEDDRRGLVDSRLRRVEALGRRVRVVDQAGGVAIKLRVDHAAL